MTAGGITVRALHEDDRPQWEGLWAGYNAFYGRAGASALPAAMVDTTWRRFQDPAEPMHALVAEQRGQLVGIAHYLFHRSTILLQATCYLQDLYTAEHTRGRGVGRRLILSVYERAAAAGAARVYWHTHESNASAMRLYDQVGERSGFVVYRRTL